MTALARIRHAVPFDPLFLARSPLFWPLHRATRALGATTDFPAVEALGAVFAGNAGDAPWPPVRFVAAPPRPRRRARAEGRPPIDPNALYDARITREGVVPTRAGSWHDLMNALVWGTFPRAKRALHARQHRAITERIMPGALTLPPARTRELDALALLDEGGVVLLMPGHGRDAGGADEPTAVVFGHAVYESLALGIPPAIVASLAIADGAVDADARVRAADEGLARIIADRRRLCGPDELSRLDLQRYPVPALSTSL